MRLDNTFANEAHFVLDFFFSFFLPYSDII